MLSPSRLIKGNEQKVCTERNGIVVEWNKESETKEGIFLSFLVLLRLDWEGGLRLGTIQQPGVKLKVAGVVRIEYLRAAGLLVVESQESLYIYKWIEEKYELKQVFRAEKKGFKPIFKIDVQKTIDIEWTSADKPETYSRQVLRWQPEHEQFESIQVSNKTLCDNLATVARQSSRLNANEATDTKQIGKVLPSIQETVSSAESIRHNLSISTSELIEKMLPDIVSNNLPTLLKKARITEHEFIASHAKRLQSHAQTQYFLANLGPLFEYRVLRIHFAKNYLQGRDLERQITEVQTQKLGRRGFAGEPVCKLCKIHAGKKTLWELAGNLGITDQKVLSWEEEEHRAWIVKRTNEDPSKSVSGHVGCYVRSAHKNQEVWEQIKRAKQIHKRVQEVNQLLEDSARSARFVAREERTSPEELYWWP